MPTGNPLEQLRRRMQSHATPTAFAALAEEHRRAGRFADAVAVCREGLERYPAYVSARVTLGRALLDSGDAQGAVTELELAVAQSPDNLAAARVLETARAALGDTAWPPASTAAPAPAAAAPPADAVVAADLPLHQVGDAAPSPSPSSAIAQALGAAPDSPQEFGLAPDWSLPDALPPLPVVTPPPLPQVEEHSTTASLQPGGMDAESVSAQGEEPAGIWAVPSGQPDGEPETPDTDPAWSWSAGSSSSEPTIVWGAEEPAAVATQDASLDWGDLTIEVPADDIVAASATSEPASADPAAAAAEDVPIEQVVVDGEQEPSGDEASSPFWSASFGGEPVAEESSPFTGWGEDAPPAAADADRSPWSDGPDADSAPSWSSPDGPSAAWALGDLHEAEGADATPFQGTLDAEESRPEPFATLADAPELEAAPAGTDAAPVSAEGEEAGMVETHPAWETSDASSPVDAGWSGSVKSALCEVFALAGHGDSLEPPVHPSPGVRNAMADTAVDAARDDAELREDVPPVLASLEQVLAAVRERRAALSRSLDS